MKRLTKEEMQKYLLPENRKTGVNAITEAMLSSIDMDNIDTFVRSGNIVTTSSGRKYQYDSFTPRSGSYVFKPSFAGSQILIGKDDNGELLFSNGRWFVC